ncbi:hypothetical protein SASPL_134376 [Salvia splendens]|uniref:Non-haem dioxygenase N-terminal domain-containing protein n=1 Tax=Salvia splendens TaxID=180675 RepID=A0A8X8ZJ90_SALSN|nr:hypothetical protein SASPL_134376 [Salvia splendens]
MAAAAVSDHSSADDTCFDNPFEYKKSVQSIVDSSDLKHLPSKYNLELGGVDDTSATSCKSLPVIDYSSLTSTDPNRRSEAVAEFARACADWGFKKSVQSIVDSSDLKHLPSKYNLELGGGNDTSVTSCESLPVIDYSALTSADPHQRSKAVAELAAACADWGFFILVNHGVPEELIASLFTTVREFFSLPDDEKKQYHAKST